MASALTFTYAIRATELDNGVVLVEAQCAECPRASFMVAVPIPGEEWKRAE